jgi:hypothetical protein
LLETSDNKLIPLLIHNQSSHPGEFVILADPEGKDHIPSDLLSEIIKTGQGIAIVDLTGTGEASSSSEGSSYRWSKLRTISRSELWFGRTIIGEWVKELYIVIQFLNSEYKTSKVTIDGNKEAGLAGLFLGALEGKAGNLILRKAPVSYLFDTREGIDFFSMGIHLPGFLKWGDISLAAALSSENILFIDPVSMSGNAISKEKLPEVKAEFEKIRTLCQLTGKTVFR